MPIRTISENSDLVLPALAAGIAAYAGHKLYKKYKQKQLFKKYGIKEEPKKDVNPDDEDIKRDMAYYIAADLPTHLAYSSQVKR